MLLTCKCSPISPKKAIFEILKPPIQDYASSSRLLNRTGSISWFSKTGSKKNPSKMRQKTFWRVFLFTHSSLAQQNLVERKTYIVEELQSAAFHQSWSATSFFAVIWCIYVKACFFSKAHRLCFEKNIVTQQRKKIHHMFFFVISARFHSEAPVAPHEYYGMIIVIAEHLFSLCN